MKYNSELIKEKTAIIDELITQLKADLVSEKLTGEMLKDLKHRVEEIIYEDF